MSDFIPSLPANAPFTPAQRAYINGFLAGALSSSGSPAAVDLSGLLGSAMAQAPVEAVPVQEAEEDESTFAWKDDTLPIGERMELAKGRPQPLVLMSAMAQLDCGSCGYLCRSYAQAIADGSEKDLTKCVPGGKETAKALKQIVKDAPASTSPPTGPVALAPARTSAPAASTSPSASEPFYDKENPFPASILDIRPLHRKDSEKDTRLVRLSLKGSGLHYEVGDALGVYPENDPSLVEEILRELDVTGEEPVPTPEGRVVPLRVALQKAYVVNKCTDELLEALRRYATIPNEAHSLESLCDGEADGYMEGRDVLDVLRDFPSARTLLRQRDLHALVRSLPVLRPRLYSISSSLRAHPSEVHLTVGVVRFRRDGCDRLRKGVASTFLSERMRPGERVGVFVQKAHAFALPQDGSVPIIMVGPGTGIAPFRAFLQEREATGASGGNWLFFGDQREECDFLLRPELEAWQQKGVLTRLDTAFSRDQEKKIYVQHRMVEQGAELWKWLEGGAHFYVCGDAGRMAKDVDAALQQVARENGGLNQAGAKAYIAEMAKAGRYQRDVY
jgi:sulfite reductase (NADPH) flavoprotein alpha-component